MQKPCGRGPSGMLLPARAPYALVSTSKGKISACTILLSTSSGCQSRPSRVRALAVLRPSSVESHFEALRTPGLTALVGREEESDLLLRRWSKGKAGEGQVVLLSGEAGIGKSRLTVGLLECLADEPHTRLRYFCSPRRTNSPLYPIIAQAERAAGLAHDDTLQARLDKLDAMLAKTSTLPADDAGL
jgi:AAA ATPase domain